MRSASIQPMRLPRSVAREHLYAGFHPSIRAQRQAGECQSHGPNQCEASDENMLPSAPADDSHALVRVKSDIMIAHFQEGKCTVLEPGAPSQAEEKRDVPRICVCISLFYHQMPP